MDLATLQLQNLQLNVLRQKEEDKCESASLMTLIQNITSRRKKDSLQLNLKRLCKNTIWMKKMDNFSQTNFLSSDSQKCALLR